VQGVKPMIEALQRYLSQAISNLHIMKAVEFEYEDEYNPEPPIWYSDEYSMKYFTIAMQLVTDEELRQQIESKYGVE